jgi:uncharacterized protein (TIGR03905 family)
MYTFIPQGVCAKKITFDYENGKISHIVFEGGCNGNSQGVAVLADGQRAEDLIEKLSCIKCKQKDTSCPAQLAIALQQVIEGKNF